MSKRTHSISKTIAMLSRRFGMAALLAGTTMLVALPAASAKTKPAPQPQAGDVLIAGG